MYVGDVISSACGRDDKDITSNVVNENEATRDYRRFPIAGNPPINSVSDRLSFNLTVCEDVVTSILLSSCLCPSDAPLYALAPILVKHYK